MKAIQRILAVILSISLVLPSYPVSVNASSEIAEKEITAVQQDVQESAVDEVEKVTPEEEQPAHQELTAVAESTYGDEEFNASLELLKERTLELSAVNANLASRMTNTFSSQSGKLTSTATPMTRNLNKEEIDELVLAGAGLEDIYWVNLLTKKVDWSAQTLYTYKQDHGQTWEETEADIIRQAGTEQTTVTEDVYEESKLNGIKREGSPLDMESAGVETDSLVASLSVQDSVYEAIPLDEPLKLDDSALLGEEDSFAVFALAVTSALDGLESQQLINQTNKQQYADRTGTAEVIDPVTGSLTWKENNISLPGRDGLDLNIGVMYNTNQSFSYMRHLNSAGQIKKYNYYNSRYDLGLGWAFQFPSVQFEGSYPYYHDGQGAVYYVELNATSGLEKTTHLAGYQGLDKQFNSDKGSFSNGQVNSAYVLQYKSGKKEYFGDDGRLLGIVDRYGNQITFQHIKRLSYDGATYPLISTITDSVNRVVTFDYDSTLQSSSFAGENITVSVKVNGSVTEKVVYKKWRMDLLFNGVADGYAPYLEAITNQNNESTSYSYSVMIGRFNFKNKEWTGAGSNSYHALSKVQYPYSSSSYEYTLATRNLGRFGLAEEVRIASRNDMLIGNTKTYNKQTYSFTGDYAGYGGYPDSNMPVEARFSTTITTTSSDSATNGYQETYWFNGLQQQVSTVQSAPNGERKETRNLSFDTTQTYRPTEIAYMDFVSGDDDSSANVLYQGLAYGYTGAIIFETKQLPESKFKYSDVKYRNGTSYEYSGQYDQLSRITNFQNDSTQQNETYTYTSSGRLSTVTNALGEVTSYSYDPVPGDALKISKVIEQKQMQDGSTAKTTTTYGAEYGYAFPTEVVSEFNNVSASGVKTSSSVKKTYTYDFASGRVLSESDSNGNKTTYTYDALGRVLTVSYPMVTNLNGEQYYTQDMYTYTRVYGNGSPFDATNSAAYYLRVNSKQKYTQKSTGTVTYLNQQNEYYDGFGLLRLSQIVDTGAITQYHIDDLTRAVYVIDPMSNTTTATYDEWGRQNEAVDTYGNLYVNEYQLKQRKQISYLVAAADVSAYRSSPATASPKKSYLEKTYSIWGELLSNQTYKDWPSQSVPLKESYSYDIAGNLITYTDPNNNKNSDGVTATYAYDKLNRLTQVKDALDQITKYQYDRNGQIMSTTIQSGASGTPVTLNTKAYNELGLLVNKQDSSSQNENVTYNQLGLPERKQDRNGTTSTYQYDERGQMVRSVLTGTSGATQETRLILGSSGIKNSTREMTVNGATATQVTTIDGVSRVSKLSSSASGYSAATSYIYDKANRTTRLTTTLGSTTSYTNYSYQQLRLYQVQTDGKAAVNSAASVNATYEYNALGNVTRITYPTLTGGGVLKTEYQYNALNQVASMQNVNGSTVLSSFTYTYDNNGNITTISETRKDVAAQSTTYSYDKLNRLIKIVLPSGGTTEYTYDLRGNRLTAAESGSTPFESGDVSYTYDLQNTLIGVVKGTSTIAFTYLPSGLRYQKKKDSVTTQYNYNGAGQVISETRSDGQQAAYVRGDRLLVKKDLTSGKDYYYLYNGHGDVVQIVDSSGTLVNNYVYDVWGNITSQTEGITNSFKYAGEMYDDETGLYYLRARYYDSSIGRFLNEDTYEGQIDNPLSQNLYTYVGNNPIKYVDPSGHCFWDACILEGAAAAALVEGALFVIGAASVMIWHNSSAAPVEVPRTDVSKPKLKVIQGGKNNNNSQQTKPMAPPVTQPNNNDDKNKERILLYHYTDKQGYDGILSSRQINPSLKALRPTDARYGDGVYLTDIAPNTMSYQELSKKMYNNVNQTNKTTYYFAIDITDLVIKYGRDNVYVYLTQTPLDISDRLVSAGYNRGNTSPNIRP